MKWVAHKAIDSDEAFDAAVAAGVDMLEFDVIPERPDGSGELFLAHDFEDLAKRRQTALTLDEGLERLCATGLELDVDLKLVGYEERVVAALREHDAIERSLISTMEEASLRAVRAAAPEVRLGWSVPRVKKDPFRSPFTMVPAYGMLQVLKRTMPRQVARALREKRIDAVMANHHLVTRALVRAVEDGGGELYVWTVDEPARVESLRRLGVRAIITNQPTISQVAAE